MSGWQLSEKWGWQMSQKGGWQMSQNRGWQMSGWHMYHIPHALIFIFMVNGKNLLFIRVLAFRLVSAVLRAQQLSTNRQDWLLTAGGMAPLGDPNA